MYYGYLLSLLVLACSRAVLAQTEEEVKATIMAEYRRSSLPPMDEEPVEVDLGLNIAALSAMSQIDGTFTVNIWLRMAWSDPRLSWNTTKDADGNCIQRAGYNDPPCMMTFPTDPEIDDSVWVPDILLFNTAETPLVGLLQTHVIAYPGGSVSWSRPGLLSATCKFALTEFPYDTQNCWLQFGSWAYDAGALTLKVNRRFDPIAEFTALVENEEWRFMYHRGELVSKKYGCCKYPFETVNVYFLAERRSHYYQAVIMNPAIALTSTIVLSALIPFNSGERISYVTAMILTLVLFLVMIAGELPKTDQTTVVTNLFLGLLYGGLGFLFLTIVWIRWCDHLQYVEQQRHRKEQNELLRQAGSTNRSASNLPVENRGFVSKMLSAMSSISHSSADNSGDRKVKFNTATSA